MDHDEALQRAQEDAAGLLRDIGGVVRDIPRPVGLAEVAEIAQLLGAFVDAHAEAFTEQALHHLSEAAFAESGEVTLSNVRGYLHLAASQNPPLWLSLFEFPASKATTIHDHGSWGVIHLVGGRDRVSLFERQGDPAGEVDVVLLQEWVLRQGDTAWWFDPPRNVHQQEALDDHPAYGLVLMGHDPTTKMQHQFDPGARTATLVPYKL